MKYCLIFILICNHCYAQVTKKVLIETFTSASCKECYANNASVNDLINRYKGVAISINYPMDIPIKDGDPMNIPNKLEFAERLKYYSASRIPLSKLNAYNFSFSDIDKLSKEPVSIDIELDHKLNANNDSISVDITLSNYGLLDLPAMDIHIIIIEKIIEFPFAPGVNKEKIFHNVARKMLPNPKGTLIQSLAPGEFQSFSINAKLPTYFYNFNNIGVVAFAQLNGKGIQKILQAAESSPKPIVGEFVDIKNTVALESFDNECDHLVNFNINITNQSTLQRTIDSIDFVFRINDTNIVKKTWKGSLGQNESQNFKVENVRLSEEFFSINSWIEGMGYRGQEIHDFIKTNSMANIDLFTFPMIPKKEKINQTFELGKFQNTLETLIKSDKLKLLRIDSTAFTGGMYIDVYPIGLGAYGLSRYSSLFVFDDTAALNNSASLYLYPVNLSRSINTQMKFSYAYAQKDTNSKDNFKILVSEDCGKNWIKVYDKSGAALASVVNPNLKNRWKPNYWLPLKNEWKTEQINLSKYDGSPELLIQCIGTAGGGWSLFLDDIIVEPGPTKTIEHTKVISNLKITPNPVRSNFKISFFATNNGSTNISLIDILGKKIINLAQEMKIQYGMNEFSFNLEGISKGSYIIKVETSEEIRCQKLINE